MSRFLSSRLKNLEPYTPGEQPQIQNLIKLNTNESPFPPSKLAQKLAKIESKKLYLYPDPDVTELTKTVAETYGVGQENVILTNGSDEVLNFAFMAFCDENRQAVFPDITYGFYKVFADINNLPFKEIPLKEDFTISVEDYINEKGTVFIANPNAPTGIVLPLSDIERILKANPNRIVVVDEAYVDFGGESAVKLVDKYNNLLVTQTFSKSRSMAGARLGFGIACKEIIEDLNRIRYSTNPYNVNSVTAAAGIGAIKDEEYFRTNCNEIIKNREWTKEQLKKLGFTFTNSKANFLFIKHQNIDGEKLYLRLKEEGILIRHFTQDRIKDYNRVTVGSEKEMQIFIQKVIEILQLEGSK
jgi:histidinol-phosphate aminotransferase